jgi:hypothetical protein
MNFKGKYEAIIESTLGRYQQGGIMGGDIVTIKKNALNHPKVKDMADNLKGNIKMLMDTDLNITVIGVRSTRDSRGEMSDGLGLSSTTSPTDFWLDVAVLHSPGLRGDPITIPIEVAERVDFGGNMPSVPDSLKRKGNINIKPIDASKYVVRMGESLEDTFDGMQPEMGEKEVENVTVRVPLEDTDEAKDVFDQMEVTWSVIGTNRFELHGTLDNIQNSLNSIGSAGEENVDVEYVEGEDDFNSATQQIPNLSGKPDGEEKKPNPFEDDEANLEEAYKRIGLGTPQSAIYTISVPTAFAENVVTYLAAEGVSNITSIDGNLTLIDIVTTSDEGGIEEALRSNVMGDLTYLTVTKSATT